MPGARYKHEGGADTKWHPPLPALYQAPSYTRLATEDCYTGRSEHGTSPACAWRSRVGAMLSRRFWRLISSRIERAAASASLASASHRLSPYRTSWNGNDLWLGFSTGFFNSPDDRVYCLRSHFVEWPLDGCEAEGLAARGFLIAKTQDGKILWNAEIEIGDGLEHARCLRVIGNGDQGDIRVV